MTVDNIVFVMFLEKSFKKSVKSRQIKIFTNR